MPQHRTFDTLLEMKDAGLVAASGAAEVDSVAKIIDLGADVPAGAGEMWAQLMLEVTALEIASNDEIYDIVLQGSPDADFSTAANIVELCAMSLSASEVKRTDCDRDDTIGRYRLLFTNAFDNTVYRYLRLYTVVAGTIATGINYTAYIARLP